MQSPWGLVQRRQSLLAIPLSTPVYDVVLEKDAEGVAQGIDGPIRLGNLSLQPGDGMDIRNSLHICQEAIFVRIVNKNIVL